MSSPSIWDVSWFKVIYRRNVQIARSQHFLQGILRSLEEAHLPSKTSRLMAQQLQTIAHVASFKHPALRPAPSHSPGRPTSRLRLKAGFEELETT